MPPLIVAAAVIGSENGTSEPGEMPARRYPMRGPDEGVFGDLNQEIQRNTNLVRHSLAGLLGLAVAHLCDQSTRELQASLYRDFPMRLHAGRCQHRVQLG